MVFKEGMESGEFGDDIILEAEFRESLKEALPE
jgi:hypothetical protein